MLRKSSANANRRQFLAAASSVAVVTSFASAKGSSFAQAPPAPAPDHLVTVDITTPHKISYWVGNPPQDASSLPVKSGESVAWQAKTHGASHRLTILFIKDTPFTDIGGGVYAFEGSETSEPNGIGGNIGKVPAQDYKYYVAVFDHATNHTHTDDPKIIVGKGDDAKEEMGLALDDLKIADAKLSDKPKLQKQLKSIERELENLIDELK